MRNTLLLLRVLTTVATFGLGLAAPAPVASAAPAPSILFADVASGPVTGGPGNRGTPISIFGKGFGSAKGTSTVTIGGVEVAGYTAWGQNNANNTRLDMITVQPGASVTGGPIVVTVGGLASNGDVRFQKNGGKVLYLAPAGSDGGSCTESGPCKSVLHALSSARSQPGDIILVRGGNYDESEMWIRDNMGMSGTAAQHKTVKAYPGETATFTNGARGVAIAAHYLTFSGLHFRNGKSIGIADDYGNKAAIGRGVWIINNTVIGPISYDGIGSHGSDHIIAGNVVRVESSSQGTQGHCFYISHGDNVKVLYNIADGAPGYGIHLFDQVRQKNDYRRTITNFLIEGNVITGSPQRSGLLMVMDDGGGWGTYGNYMDNVVVRNNVFARNNHHGIVLGQFVRNIKIYNNTFYENGRQGIFVGENPALTGVEIRNNLIYQSANSGVCKTYCEWYQVAHIQDVLGNSARVTIDNNGYFPGAPILVKGSGSNTGAGPSDPHAVTGAAGFTNANGSDFTLTSGSAAINKGASLSAAARDFNGGARPGGAAYDLGAYEFGSGGGAPAPVLTHVTVPNAPPPPAPLATPAAGNATAAGPTETSPKSAASTSTFRPPPGTCRNGPIKTACLCGGVKRTDNFCCNGEWFSYDACGSAPAAANAKPTGQMAGVTADGNLYGWATDSSDPSMAVKVQLFIDKKPGAKGAVAVDVICNLARVGVEGKHAFSYQVPAQYRDGKPHQVWAVAADLTDPDNVVELSGSPRSFKLAPIRR